MKNAILKIGLALGSALLNTEKVIFWHTGYRLPLLRKFHAWQAERDRRALRLEQLLNA